MSLPKFDYIAPKTLNELFELLDKYGERAKIKAGGTDLLIKMNNKVLKPEVIIGLKDIQELKFIKFDEKEGLRIGALATLSEVANNSVVKERYPSVAYAASVTATNQVRNMGTVIGNLCNAAPSADNAPALLALGAKAIIASRNGEKSIPLDEFFKGPGLTVLNSNEILKEVIAPIQSPNSFTVYKKLSPRSAVDIAIVNVGVSVEVKDNRFTNANIFLGAVAPIPLRAKKTEEYLKGKEVSENTIYEAGKVASSEASPITDVRSSQEYRKLMVEIITRRAILEAVDNIKN